MTVKEVKEILERCGENFVDVEMYTFIGRNHDIHTDTIQYYDYGKDVDSMEVEEWDLMDEEAYDSSINANSSETTDFATWYDDKDAKVLVIIVKEE